MSVEITVTIKCDGCGATVKGAIGHRTTQWFESYSDAQKQAKAMGWVILLRYGPARHYCAACADGVPITVQDEKQG